LISDEEFRKMKSTAFLVNVGRAKVVNEKALYEALKARRIAGAGLDVWYLYPERDSDKQLPSQFPLQELDNVIFSGHKPSMETMVYRMRKIAENIGRLYHGKTLENVVYTT